MRVLVISDIHGNLPALEAVCHHTPAHDRAIVAGDLCFDGPNPAEVLDLLDELGWELVMGNTDRDLLGSGNQFKPAKRARVAWTRDQLGTRRLDRLASLPFSREIVVGGRVEALVVHANALTIDDHLYPTMSEEELAPFLAQVQAPVLAFGHLHISYTRTVRGILLVDVASVGHPKDGDHRACFSLLEWNQGVRTVQQTRVPYDIERTVSLLRQSGMPGAEEQINSLLKASY